MCPHTSEPIGVYVHIPFCARRCPYCDFATVAGHDHLIAKYASAVCGEIRGSAMRGRSVRSVYFGGGTPTHVGVGECIEPIMHALRETFTFLPDAEISFEANPASSDSAKYRRFREGGFNRVSIGIQSFDDRTLRQLGRLHNADEAISAYRTARDSGFASVSIDLIFGCPAQSVAQWQHDLDVAVALGPDHISAYGLTIEDGAPYSAMHRTGALPLPSDDDAAAMFAATIAVLADAGYEHYEVSNYARPGHSCRHNMVYWRHQEYAGFGAGAAAYVGGIRTMNERSPDRYVERMSALGSAVAYSETLTEPQLLTEALMLGLRLLDGISLPELSDRFGEDIIARLLPALRSLGDRGLLDVSHERVRLSSAGVMLADTVLVDLVARIG